ncbi:MAG: hypothetical protein F6K09_03105 [Merismopedia sp. SIO2A8]|nr:hypothetical protein [Merismopedia sp. SIO2A8]
MNTPSHSIINLWILGQGQSPALQTAVLIGSILPDAPMFLFYFVEKVIYRTPEMQIWREHYYIEGWQNFFDVFNSLPFILVGFAVMWWRQSSVGMAFFASMALHALGDLPLHHDDGHRHFFPFSNWRFESPVSYWDPNHHGRIAAPIEMLIAIIGCVVLFPTYQSWVGRGLILTLGASYGSYIIYALFVWA